MNIKVGRLTGDRPTVKGSELVKGIFGPGRQDSQVSEMLQWSDVLGQEKTKDYFQQVMAFVAGRRSQGVEVYPPHSEVFNAIRLCPLDVLKVVIVGQDPYHGPGQAHGLSFSVKPPVPPPPSLVNVFSELQTDLGLSRPHHGCLEHWAKQGVLLLNSVLTVERGQPQSHAGKGWETFTDRVIEVVNQSTQSTVFLLWGSPAQKKGASIDSNRHLVLKAPHPSPLSAHRGFLGCRHFSKCNDYLRGQGRQPIDWSLPPIPEPS